MNKDNNIQSNNNIPEFQSPFEQLREVDAGGKVVRSGETRVS